MTETPRDSHPLLEDLVGPTPRILVLRGGRVGDFLSATPALRELRRAVPGSQIGVIIAAGLQEFVRRYPSIDEIFVAPGWPGVADGPLDEASRSAFFRRLRAWKADLALQFNGGGECSNPLLLQLGARLTAGVRHPSAPDLDVTVPYIKTQAVRFRYLDVLRALGISPQSTALDLPPHADDERDLAAALPDGLNPEDLAQQGLLGVHVGANSGARRWPIERFARVIDALAREFGLRPVIVGSETDLGIALEQSVSRSTNTLNLTGRTSLGGLVAMIRRLTLLIGSDSGPAHIAEAVGTPSVVIFGSGHPLNWGPTAQAWHRIVADWTAPCRWFRPDGCPDDSSVPCLQSVTPDAVIREASDLLRRLEQVQELGRPAPGPDQMLSGCGPPAPSEETGPGTPSSDDLA